MFLFKKIKGLVVASLTLLMTADALAAADLSRVYELVNQFEQALRTNQQRYGAADVARMEGFLNDAIGRANNPSGGGGSGQVRCVEVAYAGPFSQDQAIRLCEGGGTEATAQCGIKAYGGPFSAEQALGLCQGQNSLVPADCGIRAYSGPFSAVQALQLCAGRANSETADCGIRAYSGPFSADQSLRLCQGGGTLATAQCGIDAYRTVSAEEAVRLCKAE